MVQQRKQCFHSFISTTANGFLLCAQCGTVARLVDGKPVAQPVTNKKSVKRVVRWAVPTTISDGTFTKSENEVLLGKRSLIEYWNIK